MLEAREISFAYRGKPAIYEGLNLTVEKGERVALSAPSGFGKTTLCRILAGYLRPTSGSVLVDGEPMHLRGRRPVQMVLQHPETAVDPRMRMAATLAEANVGDGKSVTLASGAMSQEHVNLLERLGIQEKWLPRYPHELSGGELQRFCIARALASNPRYLIADEISTMLDAVTQAQIWRVIMEEADRRGLGIVLVSHSPALVSRVATRIVKLG